MPFVKGQGGRKPGASNKTSIALREAVNAILDGHMEGYNETLEVLRETQPAKYEAAIRGLMEFNIPKLKAVDQTIEMGDDTLRGIEVLIKK